VCTGSTLYSPYAPLGTVSPATPNATDLPCPQRQLSDNVRDTSIPRNVDYGNTPALAPELLVADSGLPEFSIVCNSNHTCKYCVPEGQQRRYNTIPLAVSESEEEISLVGLNRFIVQQHYTRAKTKNER